MNSQLSQPFDHRLTRRSFLHGAGALAASAALPSGLFASAAQVAAPGERRLVLVKLEGGNDALSTLFPRENDAYRRARPKIAQRGGVPLDEAWALHERLSSLRELWDAGRLALFPGIGYPQPDRSHFRSMDIWESARPERVDLGSGWLGRALDQLVAGGASGPLACSLGSTRLPLSLLAREAQSACASEVDQLVGDLELDGHSLELLRAMGQGDDPAARSLAAWLAARERLRALPANKERQGSRLAQDLQGVARLLRADLGARVLHVAQAGYDTHARQADTHGALLGELGEALRSFVSELRRGGLYERTTIFVFSEFGRRVRENGSLGTDHGAGGLALLLGGAVRGGFRSAQPSLEDLDDGDLRYTIDFRAVYHALLREVLGVEDQELASHAIAELRLLEAR
ncbi:MAG: DUF1501 domain-containing protein [Planctomycetes bacterium]|nr:DUF1501 domain-containing protein [Planctomycetota bacterium]